MEPNLTNQMLLVDDVLLFDIPGISQVGHSIYDRNLRNHPQVHQIAQERNSISHPRRLPYNAQEVAVPGFGEARNSTNQGRNLPVDEEVAIFDAPYISQIEQFIDRRIRLPNPNISRLEQFIDQRISLPNHHQVLQRVREGRFLYNQDMGMPLDIDSMPYEELLALQEQIGTIRTGLSEETILSQLKTRISHLNESEDRDEEAEICIICQAEYEIQEKIGTLNCGHEYHEDCIKQWLLEKNVCPICKRPALDDQRRHE